ncbi:MAG: sigma-70 family RNA polymerase sigma factor [Motiliproteus sp.]
MRTPDTSSDPHQKIENYLRGCAQGKHQDLKKLYELTSANLFSISLRILNDRALAEDCLQQVFIKVWNHAGRYDASKAKGRTWLNTIARNQALDMLRRNKHNDKHDGDDALEYVEDQSASQEQQVSSWQDSQQLHRCLEQIPEQQRLCLELAYFEGLTHQGLSERIETSLGTVKTWIRRGLARLQTCMNSI